MILVNCFEFPTCTDTLNFCKTGFECGSKDNTQKNHYTNLRPDISSHHTNLQS